MAKTLAQLLDGDNMEGGENFCDTIYNSLKNHWRQADPRTALTLIQPGMIVSDSDDEKLYHRQAAAYNEIIQGDTAITDNVAIIFGDTPVAGDSSIEYDEATNDAIIWGVPVTPKRGVIICRQADIAIDFTPEITASTQAVFWFIDADTDSYLGVGHQADDRPGIWSGAADTSILALQYDANADITIFENSAAAENRLIRIYGYVTAGAAARYGYFQVEDTNDEFIIGAENNANIEGVTVLLNEANQRFRIRGGIGAQIMNNLLWIFGDDDDASMEYCEATNDAWIFGVPVSPKRGVIWCNRADVAQDFTGLISASDFVQHHIPDNDRDSEFVWGFYADDVGLLTVPANPLREQMLYNADFGVWSRSGLASGTTGAQSDYEIGSAIYNETAEAADDSGNWAKTDCTMVRTNDPGNGAGGSDNYYTITETAPTQRINQALAGLTIGHIYKFSIFILNGTGTWANAVLRIMDNALTNTIESTNLATEAAWADYSVIFEATETNNQMVIDLALGGGLTAKLDNMRVIEVGPGCVGANDYGPDTWTKTSTLDLLRVQNDSTHCRGLYGVKVTKGANGAEYLNAFGRIYDKEAHYKLFRNRTVALGCWVYSVTANDNVKLQINDSDGTTESAAHCAADDLTWMEITRTCGATITSITPRILFDGDSGDVAYVSQPMLVFGSSIGEGNYRPRQQEIIWLEKFIDSNTLAGISSSDVAMTDMNLEADSDSTLSKGAKAIIILSEIRDSGSAGIQAIGIKCRADATQERQYFNSISGIGNDYYRAVDSWQKCDENGDYDYEIEATGVGTLDIAKWRYLAVQVN